MMATDQELRERWQRDEDEDSGEDTEDTQCWCCREYITVAPTLDFMPNKDVCDGCAHHLQMEAQAVIPALLDRVAKLEDRFLWISAILEKK